MSDKPKFLISTLKEAGKVTEFPCKKSEFPASVLLKYKPNIERDDGMRRKLRHVHLYVQLLVQLQ